MNRVYKYWWTLPLTLALIVVLLYIRKPVFHLPPDIKKKISFIFFYPDPGGTGYKPVGDSFKYDTTTQVLSFTAVNSTSKLGFTEQSTPDPVNDIPQYLPKLVDLLNGYKSFDSIDGKVYLTHPSELHGSQSALFIGKGTMIFVHPDKDLSDDQWQKFFNSLDMVAH